MKTLREGYRHGDLRNALVQRGIDALAAKSAADLSLRELGEAEGVSPRAPYQHFPTKQDFLRALVDEGFRRLTDAVRKHAGDMDELGRIYLQFALRQPNLFRLMFGGVHCEQTPETGEAFALLLDAIRRTNPELTDRETVGAGLACWAMVHGLATLRLEQLAPDDLLDQYSLVELGELMSLTLDRPV